MATIPVIPGVKVATKGILNRPIKDIICAILFGGLNNLLKGNLICIEADLNKLIEGMTGVAPLDNLRTALQELKAEVRAFQDHLGIGATLGRINEAISDIQKLLALDGMCRIPLKAPRIPNVINDVANSYFGAANGILNQLGKLAKPQLCLDAAGGVNTGAYHPDSILGQLNRQIDRLPTAGAGAITRFENSIKGVSNAIRKQIDRELFPDFRHNHNLLTGGAVVAGVAALTMMDVRQAYEQAQTLVSSVNSTASFPIQCASCGRGAEALASMSGSGISSVDLQGMSRLAVSQDITSGAGVGAQFDVSGRIGDTYTARLASGGQGYVVGDTVTISSTTLSTT